ncbi:glycosyl hydrolase 115 family protein [Pontiella sulfatireligans]
MLLTARQVIATASRKLTLRAIIQTALFVCVISSSGVFASEPPASVCFEGKSGMPLINNGQPLPIVISESADPAVKRGATAFAEDLYKIGGSATRIIEAGDTLKHPAVLMGVLGNHPLIDDLVSQGKVDISTIKGEWEAFQVAVVEKPWPDVEHVLVIVGADRRGAIYGAFDLSEQMGVSPWYWFADVPTVQHKNVFVTAGSVTDQPKVRYRGIFINDEDPALKGWAEKKFGGVNSGMYERVFDLILRLKGNYIWPAMWGKSFHLDDPKNTALADNMGIVMGTSHHEPMARAHAEWRRKTRNPCIGVGEWDYETNSENIKTFWRAGIERMMSKGNGSSYESLVTVGMRGDGDEPMSEGTAIDLLEKIVSDQRDIIADVTDAPADATPQVWALYKEVLDYYEKGMTVPDDVTLLFADDNWGLVRRLPTKELDREGGFGVYYHFDYVGVPRNYKWNNTIQIGKVWQQMDLSYQRGARDLWVVNVGDLKPIEYPIDFFLTMAWDPEAMDTQALAQYATGFAEQTFGRELALEIAGLIQRYGTYAATRKPELLNQNTFAIGSIGLPSLKGGPFYQHVKKWRQLQRDMIRVKAKIGEEHYAAFFQLVEWPISAMSNLYEMYFAAAWNKVLAEEGDARANHFQQIVTRNFQRDAELTDQYHQINDGKWDGMINQIHMSYVTWRHPEQQIMPPVSKVDGVKNDIAVSFVEMPQPVHIQIINAGEFSNAHNNNGLTWTRVEHLGQSSAAVVALPQGKAATRVSDNVALTYKIEQPFYGSANVTLELSPTLDTIGQGGMRLAVTIDDEPVQILNFDLHATGAGQHTAEEKAWAKAVVNNKHTIDVRFVGISPGEHVLKIFRIDDNVVLEKMIIESIQTETPAS